MEEFGTLKKYIREPTLELFKEKNAELTDEEALFIEKIKSEDVQGIKKILQSESEEKIWEYRTSNKDDNSTILHLSSYINSTTISTEIINYLKKKLSEEEFKEFINKKNKKGIIALHYASFRGNINLIEILLKYGSDINSITERGLNVIHFACRGNKPNSLTYFYLYHKDEIDFNGIDIGGSTPLHWASYSASFESVVYLVNFGAKLNQLDYMNYTPLHLAVLAENERIVRYLLQQGASINIQDKDGMTPTQLALSKGYNKIYKLLLSNKQ